MPSRSVLTAAAAAFAALALVAGVLQLLAFGAGGSARHLILGVFACAVGLSVSGAVIAAIRRNRS